MNRLVKFNYKSTLAAALGFFLILGVVFCVAFQSDMKVDGNTDYETYVANVKTALVTLENSGTLVDIPFDATELGVAGTEYTIDKPLDFMALMVLSYEHNLEGYTFYIQKYDAGYNLKEVVIGDGTYSFMGIGLNPDKPFKGNLTSTLGGGGIALELNSPLFGYLDASARINVSNSQDDVVISLNVEDAPSGLALSLVGSGVVDNTTIKNINLAGTVRNEYGCVGGVFGQIQGTEETSLVVNSLGVSSAITSVSGVCAGGLFGKIAGNVRLTIDAFLWNDGVTVTYIPNPGIIDMSHAVGALIGEIEGNGTQNPIVNLSETIAIETSRIVGASYTGGIVGKAMYCTLNLNGNVAVQGNLGTLDISCNGGLAGDTFSGGFAGYMENVTVAGASIDVVVKTSGKANFIGGFVGCLKNGTVDLEEVSFVSNYSNGTVAGGFIGSSENAAITVDTLSVSEGFSINGAVFVGGGVIGQDANSVYEISSVLYNSKSIKIVSGAESCCLGGFAGNLDSTVLNLTNGLTTTGTVVTATSTTNPLAKSIFVGGIIGKYTNNTDEIRKLTNFEVNGITLHALATTNENYVGGVIGAIEENSKTGIVSLSDCVVTKVVAQGSGKMHLGGIVGGNFAAGTTISDITAQLDRNRNSYSVGGVIGYTIEDCSITNATQMMNTDYRGSAAYANYFGGIVGVVDTGKNALVKIENVDFFENAYLSNVYNGNTVNGGIVGIAKSGTAVSLNGSIDLTNLKPTTGNNCSGYYASLVGIQENALLYVNPTNYTAENGYEYGLVIPAERYDDEVGNYGSVYRNGNLDSVNPATDLSDTSEWLITVNASNDVEVKADVDPYALATPGDCARLSIALNTENVFSGFSATCEELLAGAYTLEADIDLTNTGIQTLNKNLTESASFTGSLISTSGRKYTITNEMTAAHQGYLGLFSTVGNGAYFKDIAISMSIRYGYYATDNIYESGSGYDTSVAYRMLGKQHYGSIAAQAEGNVTVNNVSVMTVLEEDRSLVMEGSRNKTRYYGGLFGQYIATNGKELTINNVNIVSDIRISELYHYAGGAIGYVNNDKSGGTISVSDTTVSGIIQSIYDNSVTTNNNGVDEAPVGGFIACIGAVNRTDEASVDEKMEVKITNLYLNGLQIQDDLAEGKDRTFITGGLIGYKWRNVDVLAEGIYVDKLGDVASGIRVEDHLAGSVYGGLWNTVWGHMSLTDVALNAMNINVAGTAQTNRNGLLVGNGQYLYLELENYTIERLNTVINDAGALYFDEIVGYNRGTATDLNADCGGIVSITNTTEYSLYTNKVVAQKNPCSRYYYNLGADLQGVTSLSDNTVEIDSVRKIMQWSLAHYVNPKLRQFFNIAEGYETINENVTFVGTIDLGDASYYPVSVVGGNYTGSDGEIIFHGKTFDTNTTEWKLDNAEWVNQITYTYEEISEHHRLQSGLFYNVTQVNISEITLNGSVTAIERGGIMYSGALVAGGILGVELETEEGSEYINYDQNSTNITEIVLDNLVVSHVKADDWHGNYGLLIAAIDSGAKVHIGPEDSTLNTAGVSMIHYNSCNDKVAAALIGAVGHDTAQGIKLTLTNMKIADVADSVTDASVIGRDDVSSSEEKMNLAGAKVMAHASFVYNYQYILDNTTGVYIFYLDDYKSLNVTLGSEIGTTVQFYDESLMQTISDYTADGSNGCLIFDAANYKPYVYQTKEIDINPKNGNILEGCGTYDDPYVIETANQFMTLYYYLSDYERYKNTLLDWEINRFGVDTVESEAAVIEERVYEKKYYNIGLKKDANDNVIDTESTYETLTDEGFPTIEQLSNAYYMITKDIDLTLEDDFTGFGTEELPFTGVFVGNYRNQDGTEDNTRQCEILMAPTSLDGAARYGFIKYAKGAVVRNLHLNMGTDVVKLVYNGTGAGVMAVITGGDNIIDNVKVSGSVHALSLGQNQYNSSYAVLGGYVGDLQKGSAIIRGYEADALSNFTINRQGVSLDGAGTYQNGIVGKIQDGFVADDENAGVSAIYAANPAKVITNAIPDGTVLNGTDTINVSDLDNSAGLQGQITDGIAVLNKTDKIALLQGESDGYQFGLNSAQDLLVVSFAINSGAMNYWGNANIGSTSNKLTAEIYGYDKFSRCRIQDYSYVGKADIDGTARAAYLNVIKYDNGNPYTKDGETDYICNGIVYEESFYKPYIFEYFAFDGNVEILNGTTYSSKSVMNQPVEYASGNEKYLSTYNLAEGTYDMTTLAMKKCFKGIGAKADYSVGNNTTYCSLKGNFIGAGSSYSGEEDSVTTICIDLDYTKHNEAALFNLLHTGSLNNLCPYEISGFNLTGNVKNGTVKKDSYIIAAGIAPRVCGNYTFENILVSDMTVDSTLTPDTVNLINPYNTVAAAFVARADYMSYEQNNEINFIDCGIKDATVKAWDACGGFFAVNITNGSGNTFTNCKVEDSLIYSNRGNIGGFVGNTVFSIRFDKCTLEDSDVTREYNADITSVYTKPEGQEGIGGFIGFVGVDCETAVFKQCNIKGEEQGVRVSFVPYNAAYYSRHIGGFIGVAEESDGAVTFDNCNVSKLELEQRTPGYVGGFIGMNEKRLVINGEKNAVSEVLDVNIERSFQYCTGGIVGNQATPTNVDGSVISNMNITGLNIVQGWEYHCYMGGVVGHHSLGKLTVSNVHVMGTADHPTQLKFGTQTFNDSTIKLYAGGIIGYSSNSNKNSYTNLILENCSFEGEDNLPGVTYAKIVNAHYAGGLIGCYSNKNALTIINSVVKNASIQAVNTFSGGGFSGPHGAGGGIIALLDNGNTTKEGNAIIGNTVISNVIMRNYDVTLSQADTDVDKANLAYTRNKTIVFGGIAGIVKKELNITDFSVNGLNIGEDGYSGEAGAVIGMTISSPLTIKKKALETNQVTNCKIVAGVAGGLIGNTQREYASVSAKNSPVVVEDVTMDNVAVVAKYLFGTNWNLFAGGVIGRHEVADNYNASAVDDGADIHIYKNISLENSVVSSYRNGTLSSDCTKTYVGGFAGALLDCELQGYHVDFENVLVGHLKYADATSETIVPMYENVADGTTKLYVTRTDNSGSSLSYEQEELNGGTHSNCVNMNYLLNTGTWFGRVKNVANSYVAGGEVSYLPELVCFHPAIDVGLMSTDCLTLLNDQTAEMKDAYSLYGDKIHIIYADNFEETVTNGDLIGAELGLDSYRFAQLEAICNTKFAGETVDENTDYRLDDNYMQTNADGTISYPVAEVLDASYKSENGYLSPYEWNGNKIPMLVSAGKYDIDTVINTAINILTNNGGTTNGIFGVTSELTDDKFLNVAIERVKYQPDNGETPFVVIDDDKEVIIYNEKTGEFSISATDYDSVEDGTFNLIAVTYRHSLQDIYTLYLPVFVRETVKITTHMKGVEDSGYVLADMPKSDEEPVKGYTEINVELNNVYTLYSEFIYSSARDEYAEIKLNKSIYRTYENESVIQPFDVGTRITMLDISDRNMVYYYEVTKENQSNNEGRIYLSDFKAMDNSAYLTKDVSDIANYPVLDEYADICNQNGNLHKNVGMEQFIFVVDESQINATTSTIYDLYVRAEEADNVDLFKNATCNNPCFVRVNEIPKLHKLVSGSAEYETKKDKITLDGSTDTEIAEDSKISRDSTLGIMGTTYILSPSTIDQSLPNYWRFVENSTKKQFLELALSIEDINGTRITVPDGTMVTVTLDGVNYGTIVTSNSEYIYCYYDTQNGKPDPSHVDLNNCTGDIAVDFEVLFDFSSATDFSDIEDTSYQVTIEVLDTPDKDYPRNGNRCDMITVGTVQGMNRCVLGFALEAEEILNLGMNGYNSESSDRGCIAFKSRLDFSDYLDGGEEGIELLMEEFANKYFTYTYVLERKNASGSYQMFDYQPNNRYESLIKILAGQTITDWDEVPDEEQDTEKLVLVEKTVQYTMDVNKDAEAEAVKNEISRANSIMEEEFTLFANVEELLQTPANITNYKVTCYVTVSADAPIESETIEETTVKNKSKVNDFFIFTLAKLKTDME